MKHNDPEYYKLWYAENKHILKRKRKVYYRSNRRYLLAKSNAYNLRRRHPELLQEKVYPLWKSGSQPAPHNSQESGEEIGATGESSPDLSGTT